MPHSVRSAEVIEAVAEATSAAASAAINQVKGSNLPVTSPALRHHALQEMTSLSPEIGTKDP
jgi:hypothetical protein